MAGGSCTVTYTPSSTSGSVTITATYGGDSDYDGSSGSSSLAVLTPAQAAQDLIDLVNSMNLHKGTAKSLNAKLEAALDSIDSGQNTLAISQLNNFIKAVTAQTSKKIATSQATQLIAAVNNIINALR